MTERLPSLKSREVIRALKRADFSVTRTAGSHCRLVHDMDSTRQVTVPVHSGKDLKRGTVQGILRQAGLTAEEFNAFLRE
jgi:predicted RNA binding protein YcfA (HicA-like mRNA interferase family)